MNCTLWAVIVFLLGFNLGVFFNSVVFLKPGVRTNIMHSEAFQHRYFKDKRMRLKQENDTITLAERTPSPLTGQLQEIAVTAFKKCAFSEHVNRSNKSWQVLHENHEPQEGIKAPYFVYIPAGFKKSTVTPHIRKMVDVMDKYANIDAVGSFFLQDGVIQQTCSKIDICHWTILTHHEYYCSNSNMIVCDKTSDFFVSRKKHYSLVDWHMPPKLRALDFFIQMKKKGGKVVTVIDIMIEKFAPESTELERNDVSMINNFVQKYAVLQIKNLDKKETVDLCEYINCDGRLHDSIFKMQWSHLGTTMPTNFYEGYVKAFVAATKFLEFNNVSYYLDGGQNLGILKYNRLLPWDSGDVDFYVDVESAGGCKNWLRLVRAWAESKQWKHPHVDPRGATCKHYGVYAVSPSTYVEDPYSLGLVTFSDKMKKSEKTIKVTAHNVKTRVPYYWVQEQMRIYGRSMMKHQSKKGGERRCTVKEQFKHNCIKYSDGTHLDQCIEHTTFHSFN